MIVLTTPTGDIGRQVLRGLLAADAPVRVIARDPRRLELAVRDRVEVVTGSHDDADALAAATRDASAVFWLVPPNPRAGEVISYYRQFSRPLCEIAAKGDIERVVSVSTVGSGVGTHAGLVSAALAMDEQIRATGVRYRSVSPPAFMENVLRQLEPIREQGMFFAPFPADVAHALCATGDIAAAAVRLLLDDSWSGQDEVPVLGPEDLSHNEMATIMSEVLQRPIRFQSIAMEEFRQSLLRFGATEAWAQGVVDMFTAHEDIAAHTAARTPETATPTDFRQWCTEVLKPAINT